ncbi:molybdopterin-dependent oxidoreductase [Agrococcus jejuensis]|uniref:molybdopterin-dependent oxidoreductase n=1 Tax=Agrococcus jejuensis TaxID=399736 RepID=UPI0011AA7CB4|nr:molybdopterin-dependent oxidoreductase [Agrococcus jejuensis]
MTDDQRSRRRFLTGVGFATLAVTAVTAGQTIAPLAPFAAFAPRRAGAGPQGVPINRTAEEAGVLDLATASTWALIVRGGGSTLSFTRDQLLGRGQTASRLPIACVEGWSTTADWRGVRLLELVAATGQPHRGVRITSLQPDGNYRVTEMGPEFVDDPTTLVALELNGEALSLDHGYPARIIAPGRPGVLQTKWLARIDVLS